MRQRTVTARLLAAVAIAALSGGWLPAVADSGLAELRGVIRSAERTPLADVRLLAADPEQAKVYRSEPTSEDGSFTLSGLEPGTYELAVAADGGLYLVEEPLYLVAGVKRTVQIAVGIEPAGDAGDATPSDPASRPAPSFWDNPLTAGAVVLGAAVVVGVLVNNWTDSETTATRVN
jgi:hypothetical protein